MLGQRLQVKKFWRFNSKDEDGLSESEVDRLGEIFLQSKCKKFHEICCQQVKANLNSHLLRTD
jgi:hypothetical protein